MRIQINNLKDYAELAWASYREGLNEGMFGNDSKGAGAGFEFFRFSIDYLESTTNLPVSSIRLSW